MNVLWSSNEKTEKQIRAENKIPLFFLLNEKLVLLLRRQTNFFLYYVNTGKNQLKFCVVYEKT